MTKNKKNYTSDIFKGISLYTRAYFFLVSTLSTPFIYSEDFGVSGNAYQILEDDLLEYILKKNETFSSGIIDQNEIGKIMTASCKTPHPIEVSEALEYRVYFYDPTVIVQTDIEDDKGNIVIPKGTSFNPLKQQFLHQDLLFFDGNNSSHIKWAKEQNSNVKWILVDGSPLDLEEQENRPIYFDQYGILIKKLNIQNIPARVSQHEYRLQIEEISLGEANGG